MKLFYSPGACSLSPHIAALEAGFNLELVKVDTKTKKLENGDDFLAIHMSNLRPGKRIDDLLRGYGSVPEPTWYWFGEKPGRTRKK